MLATHREAIVRYISGIVRDAAEAETLCMPAMCVRFWPGWSWLRERVVDGSLGAVRSAVFRRLGTRPGWAKFYADVERSGGALFDLHVHDTDFVQWCFGTPASLSSTGSLDHLTTLYRYPGGPPHVVVEGGWDHAPGFPFQMRYTVIFEHATADFDLAHGDQCGHCAVDAGDHVRKRQRRQHRRAIVEAVDVCETAARFHQ